MFVTVAVNLDRCHAMVSSPGSPRKWKSFLLPAVVAFAVAFNVPHYFELTTETDGNETYLVPTGTLDHSWVWVRQIYICV